MKMKNLEQKIKKEQRKNKKINNKKIYEFVDFMDIVEIQLLIVKNIENGVVEMK